MLTAIVLSHNSSSTLARTLESLKFADQLIVVDDFSTDDSVDMAKSYGAKVVQHALNNNYSEHHNWAIGQASRTDWILLIHHDEVITPMLGAEIQSVVAKGKSEVNGYFIPRTDIIWGHQFKYGDGWGAKFMRLAHPGCGQWVGQIHEVWQVTGPTGVLTQAMLHYPHTSVSDFLSAVNGYSTIRAHELFAHKKKTNIIEIIFLPFFKFLNNYCFKLGMFDGIPGFVHAMIMAFYTFLVRGKLYLRYKGIFSHD